MKKTVLVLVLTVILAVAAFADHPSGWGIGILGSFGGGWASGSTVGGGAALSLKAPQLPVFWGLNLNFGSGYLGFGVTGDYYFIDRKLVPEVGLNWYVGFGGWLSFWSYSYNKNKDNAYSYAHIAAGARLPIGLSWQPLSFLEIFLDIAPSLGIGFDTKADYKSGGEAHSGGIHFPAGGWPVELGIRLWL